MVKHDEREKQVRGLLALSKKDTSLGKPRRDAREHDLESLCRDLLNRAQLVKDAEGGRIAK